MVDIQEAFHALDLEDPMPFPPTWAWGWGAVLVTLATPVSDGVDWRESDSNNSSSINTKATLVGAPDNKLLLDSQTVIDVVLDPEVSSAIATDNLPLALESESKLDHTMSILEYCHGRA